MRRSLLGEIKLSHSQKWIFISKFKIFDFLDFPNIYTVINEDRNIYILRIVSATCIALTASYRIQICMLNILKVLIDVFSYVFYAD